MAAVWVEAAGSAAALLTTASFLPQAFKVIRERETRAISLPMYLAFVTGVALWLAYGVGVGSWQIIAANVVTLAAASVILFAKLRFG